MRVGLLGLQYVSTNLGVSALTRSCLQIIVDNLDNIDEIYIFSNEKLNIHIAGKKGNRIRVKGVSRSYKSITTIRDFRNEISKCDIIMDFSEGDSFSTIYGTKRYVKILLDKVIAIRCKKKLLLMPQTYGPYNSNPFNFLLPHIFNKATCVFSRDHISTEDIRRFSSVQVEEVTDVAFFLQYEDCENKTHNDFIVGFNVSGLLWNGGYSGRNQFDLRADYRELCTDIIELIHEKDWEILLIPHVIEPNNYDAVENDLKVCEYLSSKYEYCKVARGYDNPSQVKSIISSVDLFIGSRMHSTIAALSVGVPSMPLSYSKKFVGLFSNLSYDVDVPLYKWTSGECMKYISESMENYKNLKEKVVFTQGIIENKKQIFLLKLKNLWGA